MDLLAVASGLGPEVARATATAEAEALFQVNLFQVIIAAANVVLFLAIIWTFAFKPIARILDERKARIVTVTDSTFSPLIRLSDAWLEVVESDFAGFRSLAASLAVGMALVHGVAARRGE